MDDLAARHEADRRAEEAQRIMKVGGWTVEPDMNRLVRGGEEIRLEPKVMDVLVALIEARGATVSRAELMERVWRGVFVSDDALHRAVSLLRKGLGRDPQLKNSVHTVPKRGYRLDGGVIAMHPAGAPVSQAPAPAVPARWSGPAALTGAAVLAAGAAAAWILSPGSEDSLFGDDYRVSNLTDYAGQERMPAFSPDAERVVFAWSGPEGDDWDLHVQRVGSGAAVRLTDMAGAEVNPAWSPDGETIAFVNINGESCTIHLIRADGTGLRTLRSCQARGDVSFDWMDGGETLLIADRLGTEGPLAIFARDMAAGVERQISFPPPGAYGDHMVTVNPVDERIAFVRTRGVGVSDVVVATPSGDGFTESRVTHDNTKIHGLSWAPGDDALVFSSNRAGLFSLWSVPADGSRAPARFASGGSLADFVAVSPDGRRVAFEREIVRSSLLSSTIASNAAPQAQAVFNSWSWHPRISPDGRQAAFVSDRSGNPEIWIAQLRDGGREQVTGLSASYAETPVWTEDMHILFAVVQGGGFDIMSINPATGGLTPVTRAPGDERAISLSADGGSVYFASNRTGRWQVWRRDLETGAETQITRDGGFYAQESPDGTQLYFTRKDESGLFVMELGEEAAPPRRVLDRPAPPEWRNWSFSPGGEIYFVHEREDGAPRLAAFDPASSSITELRDTPGFRASSGFATGPEGRLVYVSLEHVEADLMLIERPDA